MRDVADTRAELLQLRRVPLAAGSLREDSNAVARGHPLYADTDHLPARLSGRTNGVVLGAEDGDSTQGVDLASLFGIVEQFVLGEDTQVPDTAT